MPSEIFISSSFTERLQKFSRQLGIASSACLRLDNPLLKQRLDSAKLREAEWLRQGLHGEMDYLERTHAQRYDLRSQFPTAKSVIIVTFSNAWVDFDTKTSFPEPGPNDLIGYISAYARGNDYHNTGHDLLKNLAEMLNIDCQYEICIDTRPVQERLLAEAAGLGVIGGNNLLRAPGRGDTRVFIGCLFLEDELPEVVTQPSLPFSCSECRKCVNNCPNGALHYGTVIDARSCISYLTIEKKDVLTQPEGQSIGRWLFGCDCCTSVCPETVNDDLRIPVSLQWLLESPAGEIRRVIKNSAINYAGVTRLRRNAVVALKNIGTPETLQLLSRVRQTTGSDLIRRQIDLW